MRPFFLQLNRPLSDPFAAHPQHISNQLLRHIEFIALQPIQTQEQPPAQLLIEAVVSVAHGGLGHLRYERLGISQQQVQDRTVARELLLQCLCFHPKGMTCALYHSAARGRLTAHK